VANTVDVLVTAIADSIVANVAAWCQESLCNNIKVGILDGRLKGVLWVVTMLVSDMACNAQIVVWARSASNEVLLSKLLNARIASTSGNDQTRILGLEGSRGNSWNWLLGLWCNSLSSAVDNFSVLDEALDHPVFLTAADNTIIDTGLAEVKVSRIASAAVVVNIWDGRLAVVAKDGEDGDVVEWSSSSITDGS
jgi:hypothetical protein